LRNIWVALPLLCVCTRVMQQRSSPPLVEAFLVVEQPRQRLSHWTATLAPLDDPRVPPVAAVTAYYDPTSDQALIGLRYDEAALGAARLAFVVEIALLAELGMIQPAELSEGERRRFLGERLSRCTLAVPDQRGVVVALTELVRRIRELKAQRASVVAALPRKPTSPIAARASLAPSRAPTGGDEPVLLVHPKSTRDDLEHDDLQPYVAPAPREPTRKETVEIDPIELQQMLVQTARPAAGARSAMGVTSTALAAESATPNLRSRARSPSQSGTDRYLPTATSPMPPGIIYARYLRSGRWVPIRIGALSLKGAALMSGALPRLHDHVDVALSFGEHRALVRGSVSKVSSELEAAMTGAATFSVQFELDDVSRRQLTSLLTAARAANVTIKPPPARLARRYPVEWPICLGTSRGAVRAEALDVSRDGMFVRPQSALSLDANLTFSAVLDDGGAPIAGRGKTVRYITEAEARLCGLAPGWGLQIVDMGDDDRTRWNAFLARVERRAEKRILIGASPARLAELQAGLAAAGYAVTGGTDAGALVQLASAESRPVDAAMIDSGWLTPGTPAAWVESLFSARDVPCITVHGDGRRARAIIDKLLAVV